MENVNFILALTELTSNEKPLEVAREVKELQAKFEDYCLELERKHQVEFLIQKEQNENLEYENLEIPEKEEFYAIYQAFNERKIALISQMKLEHESNLRKKKHLIEKLQLLIQEEENIAHAMTAYKEIHDEWKNVGEIDREKKQSIQDEFSRLVDAFFSNIKIYRELKDYDLRRNFQLKKDLVLKIQALLEESSIKNIETALKNFRHEFDEIGPIPNEEWESFKETYWSAVNAVYQKVHEFYEHRKLESQTKLDAKKAILEETTQLVQKALSESKLGKEWEEYTAALLSQQEAWKKVGMGNRKENEELWGLFRAQCDLFFEEKRKYYDSIRNQFDEIATKKQQIIDSVAALKDSTEWKETTAKILALQEQWKKLGNAGRRFEQKLWKEFREQCDFFFDAKTAHFAKADAQNEGNLQAKIELIEKIRGYSLAEDKNQAIEDLKQFAAEFGAIGNVPFKKKDEIYKNYKSALDALYTQLKIEGKEKEKVMYQAKVDTMKANPNFDKIANHEIRDLQTQIQQTQQDILQFENNLGFLSNSKGADAFRKEVENKIKQSKEKIQSFKQKIALLKGE